MNWCVTSEDGVKAMCKDMGFTIPFKKNLKSDNVLVNEANKYTEEGKDSCIMELLNNAI